MSPTPAPTAETPAAAVPSADAAPFWDATPETEIPRPPLFAVVVAEPGLGKTHLALTFPGPVIVLDTEFRADEVLRKFRNVKKYWKKVEAWADVREAVVRALKTHPEGGGTLVFDSGSDLNLLAEAEVLQELARDDKKAHKTLHWGPVNKRFKGLFATLRDRRWNAVFTARLKDEWAGDNRTGARTAGGFVADKLIYHADFALQLERGPSGERVGRVLKNGARKIGTYAAILTDEDLTYAGILRAMDEETPAAGEAKAVLVPASPQGIQPARVATSAPPPAPATPAPPPVAAPSPSAPPPTSPGAALFGEAVLERAGFRKSGRVTEELGLDAAAALALEWEEARTKLASATMVTIASQLARGGWYRTPEAPAPATAKAAPKASAPPAAAPAAAPASPTPSPAAAPAASPASPPAIPGPALASAEEVAALERLAADVGSSSDAFWERVLAKGWARERGRLSAEAAAKLRGLFEAQKAKLGASPAKAA